MPKSSVYESLNRLEKHGFVKRELGNNQISKKGIVYLQAFWGGRKGVGTSRLGGRSGNNLSAHHHTFKLTIDSKEFFSKERLEMLSGNPVVENRLMNLHQHIATFEDAKIVINPKQVRINLFDVVSEGVGNSDTLCLSRALEYVELLKKVGISTEGMMVESGDWARVDSVLSNFLCKKIDGKYFIKLDDGTDFWVDNSTGVPEDETNNKITRQKVDDFLNDVVTSNYRISDLGKVESALGHLARIEAIRTKRDVLMEKQRINNPSNTNIPQPISQLNPDPRYTGYLG